MPEWRAYLSFEILHAMCRLSRGQGLIETPNGDPRSDLSFRVKPKHDCRVTLSSGESFASIYGGLRVSVCADARLQPVGTLTYSAPSKSHDGEFNAPASYFIDVSIPQNQFDYLFASLIAGRMPTTAALHVAGMTLPTEFEYHWDVSAKAVLDVSSVEHGIVLMADDDAPKPKFFSEVSMSKTHPATRGDFFRWASELNASLLKQAVETQRLRVTLIVCAVAGAAALFYAAHRFW
jgi:hypothetical protein